MSTYMAASDAHAARTAAHAGQPPARDDVHAVLAVYHGEQALRDGVERAATEGWTVRSIEPAVRNSGTRSHAVRWLRSLLGIPERQQIFSVVYGAHSTTPRTFPGRTPTLPQSERLTAARLREIAGQLSRDAVTSAASDLPAPLPQTPAPERNAKRVIGRPE